MVSIFCSHSGKDADQVLSLKHSLEAIGHTVYCFEDDAQPGKPIMGKIQKAIDKADIILAYFTQNSLGSDFMYDEIRYALKIGKDVIPFVEAGFPDDALGPVKGKEPIVFDRKHNPGKVTFEAHTTLSNHLRKLDMEKLTQEILIAVLLLVLCYGIYLVVKE
jgi:hypothetical protein